jgi:transposase-like protein
MSRDGWFVFVDAPISCSSGSRGLEFGVRRYRFPPEVIVLPVRWYLRFGLSYRDAEELLAERGIEIDHVTCSGWVQRFTTLLVDQVETDLDGQ